jgi:hypothetical protein
MTAAGGIAYEHETTTNFRPLLFRPNACALRQIDTFQTSNLQPRLLRSCGFRERFAVIACGQGFEVSWVPKEIKRTNE